MRVRAILMLGLAGMLLLFAGPVMSASGAPYPPSTCPTLSISTTQPLMGGSLTVAGSSFAPNARISLELDTGAYPLGTVTSDANGAFSTTVTLPAGVVGSHRVVAVGGAVNGVSGCPSNSVQIVGIQIGAESTSATSPGTGAGGASSGTDAASASGTAFTGVNAVLLVAIAVVLIGVGVGLNRRRRTDVRS